MMFRIIVRLFLCLLTHATLWSHAQGETCQSKEFPNQRGNQNQWSGYMNLATPAECIDFCCASSSCVAVDYETVNSGCYIFSTPTELTRDASYSYYQVYTEMSDYCFLPPSTQAPTTTTPTMLTADERTTTGNEPTTTAESNGSAWSGTCPMLLQFRRAVQAPILTLQLSPASCRSLCLFIRDCMAASLLGESCHLLTDPLVWNSGNLQSWSKSCKHSQCCMTQEELSSTGTTLASFKPSALDCQTACQLVSDCWSVHFASERGTCFLYGESGTEPWEEGGQMFLKSCQTGPSLDSIMLISDCTVAKPATTTSITTTDPTSTTASTTTDTTTLTSTTTTTSTTPITTLTSTTRASATTSSTATTFTTAATKKPVTPEKSPEPYSTTAPQSSTPDPTTTPTTEFSSPLLTEVLCAEQTDMDAGIHTASTGVVAAAVTSTTLVACCGITLVALLLHGARRKRRQRHQYVPKTVSSAPDLFTVSDKPSVTATNYTIYRGYNHFFVSTENISIKQLPERAADCHHDHHHQHHQQHHHQHHQ